jgi:hypothetical protein
MSFNEVINSAVAAHGQWKQKLRQAIDTGQCESTPEKVKQDNNCAFGKWLYDRIDSSAKSSVYYKDVVDLHAQFHREAGTILELALSGDKGQANEKMKLGSEFSKTSAALTTKMKEWRDTPQ